MPETPRFLRLESVVEFQHRRQDWDSIAWHDDPDIHLTFDWILSWWEAFAGDSDVTCLLGVDGQGCFAIVPILFSSRRLGPASVKIARLLGNDFAARSNVRVLRHEQFFREEIFRLTWDRGCAWIDCGWLPATTCDYLTGGMRRAVLHRQFELPLVIFGQDWESWLQAKSRTFRKTLRKASEQCETMTIRRFPDDFSDTQELLRFMNSIMVDTWSHAEGTSYLLAESDTNFMRAIVERYATAGQAIATVLFDSEQQPLSFAFGVQLNRRVFGLKTGYRLAQSGASVGTFTMMHFARLSADRGAATMDMDVITTHGDYKHRWCDSIEAIRWDRVFNPGLVGAAAWLAYQLLGGKGALARIFRNIGKRSPGRTTITKANPE